MFPSGSFVSHTGVQCVSHYTGQHEWREYSGRNELLWVFVAAHVTDREEWYPL